MKQFEYQMKIVEMLDENLLNAYGKKWMGISGSHK
jgi:hypothetical protein